MITSTTILGVAAIALGLGCAHLLDAAPDVHGAALTDALQQAQRDAHRLRTARAECRGLIGPDAVMFEITEGHLVCRRPTPAITPSRIAGGVL
jgi:hypothetical protein